MANTYIDFYWENPLRTYNKVKKYFKRIKPKFQWTFGFRNKAKILEINSFDLMWKDKWNSPRHEYNPRMFFSLFNFIHLYVEWTSGPGSAHPQARELAQPLHEEFIKRNFIKE